MWYLHSQRTCDNESDLSVRSTSIGPAGLIGVGAYSSHVASAEPIRVVRPEAPEVVRLERTKTGTVELGFRCAKTGSQRGGAFTSSKAKGEQIWPSPKALGGLCK
jgi:hypothetical protein